MKSPLEGLLRSLGGRFETGEITAGFGGPAHFGDPIAEYEAARGAAAIADQSLMSKIELRGPDRVKFLHNLCTNDIKALAPGRGCEAFLTNVHGKILAYVRVWAAADSLWLDTVPGAAAGILAHLNRYLIMEKVEPADRTADLGCFIVAGPQAAAILVRASANALAELSDMSHIEVAIASQPCRIFRDDSIGLPGYACSVAATDSPAVWQAIQQAGQAAGLVPMGEQAVEMLRVEAGLPRYGVDIDDSNLPQEVGRVRRSVSFTKGCYLGQETVARIDALGHVNRHLVGLQLPDRHDLPPRGAAIRAAEKTVGQITSATYSPALRSAIALGYVRRANETAGTRLTVDFGGTLASAFVHSLPFIAR